MKFIMNNTINEAKNNINKKAKLKERLTDRLKHFFLNASSSYKKSPLIFKIISSLALFCLIIHIICFFSEGFSDFMVRYPNAGVRWLLAKLTNLIPFSLAEMIIILLPLFIGVMIGLGFYCSFRGSERAYRNYLCILLSVILLFYALFVLTLAPGYKGTSLSKKLGLSQDKVSAKQLYDTSLLLSEKLGDCLDSVCYGVDRTSVMPYSLDVLNDKLNDAYALLSDEHQFISRLRSNIKYVVLSKPMTYTHISGVYSYYTGEANLNTNFPDYSLPFTAAHELAHQRGCAPEDEANFIAFLACMKSDDAYIRYSAYVNILEYCLSALYEADADMYNELIGSLDARVRGEFNSYNDFFEEYRNNVVGDISGTINDTYLQTQGVMEGSKSYGLVVDLTVAYFSSDIEK